MLCCNRDWIHSNKVKVGVIISVLLGVVIMLAAVASLAYWYFAKYRNRDQVKYDNLENTQINEEENILSCSAVK
jgi:flagellar basal body-associated protein FliL